jgi:hypothetical protein
MDSNDSINGKFEIKILQINLQKSISATTLLIQYIYEKQIDIVLAQEPYLVDQKIALFPLSFHIFQSTNRPKAAIIVNPFKLQTMPLIEFIDDFNVF